MKTWFTAKATDAGTAEINIFDEIGYWGVTAGDFIREMKGLGDETDLTVLINSPGGDVFAGLTIYNALRGRKGKTTCMVMGIAASAASFIAMAGDHIVMPANTFMMVHNPMGVAIGNAGDMRELADTLDKIAASLIGIYTARTGKTTDEIKALLDAETYMTAAEAKDLGFADEVVPEIKVSARYRPERMPQPVLKAMLAGNEIRNDAGECCFGSSVSLSADGTVMVVADEGENEVYTYDWVVVQGAGSWVQRPFVTTSPNDGDEGDEGGEGGMQMSAPLADQILALARSSGFESHANVFALHSPTIEDAQRRIADAREIQTLCVVAKSNRADEFIRNMVSVAEARAALINARAGSDEALHTDTSPRPAGVPAAHAPRAVTTADIWAKRRTAAI